MGDEALDRAGELARDWLAGLAERRVGPAGAPSLGGPQAHAGEYPAAGIQAHAAGAEPGRVASTGPRDDGDVTGGTRPPELAADRRT